MPLITCTVLIIFSTFPSWGEQRHFPSDPAPGVETYGAFGNDTINDTRSIREALFDGRDHCGGDFGGSAKTSYFPEGTYYISATLDICGWEVVLQGQRPEHTISPLKNNVIDFERIDTTISMIRTGGGNRQHENLIRDMIISTGEGNPSATGLDFIASNYGGIDNVPIQSGDGQGVAGIDFRRYGPGPLLVSHMTVDRFVYGIRIAHAEYAPTFRAHYPSPHSQGWIPQFLEHSQLS